MQQAVFSSAQRFTLCRRHKHASTEEPRLLHILHRC